jgi:hypothetical protein
MKPGPGTRVTCLPARLLSVDGPAVRSGNDYSIKLPICSRKRKSLRAARSSISFDVSGMAARDSTRVFLSRSAWRKYFRSDAHIFGRMLQVDGQQAMIAGVIQDEDWRLPGQADAWLLEDDQRLSTLPSDDEGYVLAHASPSVFPSMADGRRQMYVPRKDSGYDWFVCESLAERIREPFSIFSFALLLACLALPATTSLPLGEYPAHSKRVPWNTRIRRWAFLSIKFILIVPIVYFGSLDLAYSSSSMSAWHVGVAWVVQLILGVAFRVPLGFTRSAKAVSCLPAYLDQSCAGRAILAKLPRLEWDRAHLFERSRLAARS